MSFPEAPETWSISEKMKACLFASLNACQTLNVSLPWMCKNSFSIVIGAINYSLLLMFLQYTRNYCLSNDTDAAIIHHSCSECV